MKKVVLCLVLIGSVSFLTGCSPAIIGALGSPSAAEIKEKAEYDLTKNKPEKLLVMVDQAAGIGSQTNIKQYLTTATQAVFVDRLDLKPESIILYGDLIRFRESTANYSDMTPVEVGKALKADKVLYIVIDNFSIVGLGGESYYKANLDIRSGLFDVASGKQVWPDNGTLKAVKVGSELLTVSYDKIGAQLAQAGARCIVRYLYECPRPDTRVAEEIKDLEAGL